MIVESFFSSLPKVGDIVKVGRQAYRVKGESEFEPISPEQVALLAAAQRGAAAWAIQEQEDRKARVEAHWREANLPVPVEGDQEGKG